MGENASVLNSINPNALRTILTSNMGTESLRSDCDEQLLISLQAHRLMRAAAFCRAALW